MRLCFLVVYLFIICLFAIWVFCCDAYCSLLLFVCLVFGVISNLIVLCLVLVRYLDDLIYLNLFVIYLWM